MQIIDRVSGIITGELVCGCLTALHVAFALLVNRFDGLPGWYLGEICWPSEVTTGVVASCTVWSFEHSSLALICDEYARNSLTVRHYMAY